MIDDLLRRVKEVKCCYEKLSKVEKEIKAPIKMKYKNRDSGKREEFMLLEEKKNIKNKEISDENYMQNREK